MHKDGFLRSLANPTLQGQVFSTDSPIEVVRSQERQTERLLSSHVKQFEL